MNNFPGRRFGGVKAVFLLLVAAALGVAGYAGYRIFFNRPGESAIALIPADAGVVMTLDTNPSPNQVHAYQTISESLKREGVDDKVSEGISGLLGKAGIAQEIRQYVKTSFALAFWPPDDESNSKGHGVVLLAISNPGEVTRILSTVGSEGPDGTRKLDKASMAVIGDYLVMSDDPAMIAKVGRVQRGNEPSMAGVQEFQLARADLPQDANIMVFASPSAMKAFNKMVPAQGARTFDGMQWASFGATLRDDGLQFDMRAPANTKAMPELEKLASLKPVDSASLRHLPAGAYGFLAYSSPSTIWEMVSDSVKKQPGQEEKMTKGLEEFQKATGLSIPDDLVPAFRGDLLLAAYPSANGEKKSLDFVLVANNNNGADPVALAEKMPALMEKMSKGKAKFVKSEENGVTEYMLAPEAQAEMLQSMSGGHPVEATPMPTALPSTTATPSPDEALPTTPPVTQPQSQPPHEVPAPLKDKTIAWAEVNGCVVLASSKAMLDKAVAAFHGQPTLADDDAFRATLAKRAGDQSIFVVNMRRVMEGIRPFATEIMGKNNNGPSFDDIAGIFDTGDSALFMGGKYSGNVASGTWFIPLNFDKIAQLVHKGAEASKAAQQNAPAMQLK